MASVTVPGPGGSTFSVSATYNNSNNSTIAKQIAGLLAAANSSGSLSVVSVSGSGSIPAPVTTAGAVNELLLGSVTGGQVTIPSAGSAQYVVVYEFLDTGNDPWLPWPQCAWRFREYDDYRSGLGRGG